MNQSVERKDNIIKNVIAAWKDKYNAKDKKGKIWIFVALIFFFLCILRLLVFIFSAFGDGLPDCNNSKLINDKLPTLVNNFIKRQDPSIYNPKTTISKVEEIWYDKKAGLRQCSGSLTMRADSDIETYDFTYQIAWTNKEKNEYQYRIIDVDF
ncbi:hypothetical protein I2494_11075 [Budviciaceae bacterium BWR-B9]|uniref:DUF4845 domain-containing protein n=1 Tax=Limnobaculum allomyrinae TaxID=2791986 RepID=A0ABS1IRT8_9GAMM|nr:MULTISPECIES: hypothetical protein [Limnobaculum]MBK5144252.1 hypothetical protein [Limnobaculum allomyrinae]MBV7692003.1 hypothetical protein [Limnobaculum sp. M2-1]